MRKLNLTDEQRKKRHAEQALKFYRKNAKELNRRCYEKRKALMKVGDYAVKHKLLTKGQLKLIDRIYFKD